MNPISLFHELYAKEKAITAAQIPSACCLSTMGFNGFPNARFVSLKEIKDDQFVVTGSLASRKGLEIAENNQVALTFWWISTEVQVRVQGRASIISKTLATQYFSQRNQTSKVISSVSQQGKEIDNLEVLETKLASFMETEISKPKNWSGWVIDPLYIEFLYFKTTRLHERSFYTKENKSWKHCFLQP